MGSILGRLPTQPCRYGSPAVLRSPCFTGERTIRKATSQQTRSIYVQGCLGQCGHAARRALAWQIGPDRDLETSGAWQGVCRPPQSGRRRPGGSCCPRRRTARGDGLSGRLVSILVGLLGRSDFETGQFGENLTVEGLADSDVCIGDRYRIGGAVLEVTQPRVTCYRLGIRMGHEQMPALMVAHRRPGFYFRVLEAGEIGAGD